MFVLKLAIFYDFHNVPVETLYINFKTRLHLMNYLIYTLPTLKYKVNQLHLSECSTISKYF